MKKIILIIGLILFSNAILLAAENAKKDMKSQAEEFISQSEKTSPSFGGVPLRKYEIKDVDKDGNVEVLETINDIEENSTGWLSADLSPAFDWINIYKLEGSNFVEKTCSYKDFASERKNYYKKWQQKINNPKELSKDDQSIIANDRNKTLLKKNKELISKCN